MAQNNIRMAMNSISAYKWRSFLTMLGIIISVVSIVTIVSLGEGVKHQLSAQITRTGKDLITVRGGTIVDRNEKGEITGVNLLNLFAGNNLNETDYQVVNGVPNMQLVAPFASISGAPATDDGVRANNISTVATTSKAADALSQDVQYGGFFSDSDTDSATAVIGKQVAEQLFKEDAPIGKSFQLRGQRVVVQGVFKKFAATPLTPGIDYNNTIFVPYTFGQRLTGATLQPYQILVRPNADVSSAQAANDISNALKQAHGGQTDFTVLQADDNLALASTALSLITNVVAAIAAVSLIVGGIGIMNIMLVSVSERTHEIGVRKAVGATNKQILRQFLTEAVVLSTTGGIIGILFAILANYLLRVFTNLQPVITLPIVSVAVLVAIIVGSVFGVAPALQAARKDPIEALRRI